MDFQQAVRACFSKYADFKGRARRSEYWWWVLFVFVGNLIFGLADGVVFGFEEGSTAMFGGLFGLVCLLPSLAVTARRLHDGNRSGWLQVAPYGLMILSGLMAAMQAFILFSAAGIAAVVLGILLLVWLIQKGTGGANRFGPDPLSGHGGPPDRGDYHRSSIPRVERDN